VSPWLRGVHATIACRVSRHPVVIELCRRAGSAIVSTSANPHGTKPARSARQVHCLFPRHVFRNAIDVVIDRRVGSATSASTIIDAITGDVVRAGAPPWNTPRETLAESVR
jgi:L-threonylcarbamoyladenylate synthase